MIHAGYHRTIRIALAGALLIVLTHVARARDAASQLDVIITPNDGMPALVAPGGTMDVVATDKAELSLSGTGGSMPLEPEWVDLPGGRLKAHCVLPADIAPGAYALNAKTSDHVDTNVRSVFVFKAFPDQYTIAHVTDTHIGSNRNGRLSDDILRDVLAAVNDSGAAFVLITGDLTDQGEAAQFARFVEVLNTCTLPTFVCAGNHDRNGLNYEKTFGPDAYMFWFGKDGYIGFDTKDFYVADDLRAQPADLQIFRRTLKPARWCIGFSHRYEADMGMRTQIVLFIDNPLDWFIFGHWHRANTEKEKTVPWAGPNGATPITVTPAAINGAMRLFEIGPAGIVPGEVQNVAETK